MMTAPTPTNGVSGYSRFIADHACLQGIFQQPNSRPEILNHPLALF
jgi:hypothetical protein